MEKVTYLKSELVTRGSFPSRSEAEPTGDQVLTLSHRVNVPELTPYVDMAAWTPFGRKSMCRHWPERWHLIQVLDVLLSALLPRHRLAGRLRLPTHKLLEGVVVAGPVVGLALLVMLLLLLLLFSLLLVFTNVGKGVAAGKQDLLKAIHFIEMIIERDYNENS